MPRPLIKILELFYLRFTRWVSCLLLGLFSVASAPAADWAWSLVPTTGNFSGTTNWTSGTTPGTGNGTPASGDSLYFLTSSVLSLTNDNLSFTYSGLTYNSGANAFTISGNPFTLTGGITNLSSSSQINSCPITLSGSVVVTNLSTTQSITLSGSLSGTGILIFDGASTLQTQGTNTYSGGTIINGGTLSLVTAALQPSIGSGPVTIGSGAELNIGTAADNYTNILINNGGTLACNNGFGDTWSGNITNNATLTLVTGANTTLVLNGIITGSGGIVAPFQSGTYQQNLILRGQNTYTGVTILTNGTVEADQNNAFGTGLLVINSGTSVLTNSVSATLSNVVDLASSAIIGVQSNQVLTLSGSITNTGTLSFTGPGTLTLSGSNLYSGGTIINGGILTLSSANGQPSIGSGPVTLGSNDELYVTAGQNNYTNILINNGGELYCNNGYGDTWSGNITNNATLKLVTGANTTFTLSGIISGTGGIVGPNRSGSNRQTLILSGANTYTGGTILTNGTLEVDANTALGTGLLSILQGGTGAVLQNEVSATLTNTIDLITGGPSVTIDVGSGQNFILAGAITNNGGITVNGFGQLILSGTNSYSGTTSVTSGTLLITGNCQGVTNLWTIGNGTTLGGNGIIGGNITFAAGAIATNTVGQPLTINSSLKLNANQINLRTTSVLTRGNYLLMTNPASAISGSFSSVAISGAGLAASTTTNLWQSANAIYLGVNLTPSVTVNVGTYTYNGNPTGPTTQTTSPAPDNGTATWSYAGTGATVYGPSSNPPTFAGNYTATASLAIDTIDNLNPASSSATPFTITQASTTLALTTTSPNPFSSGSNVTFTAALSVVSPGAGTPTGTVNFRVDGSIVGSGTLTGGAATFTTNNLTRGLHTVVAEYAGDGNFLGSTNSLIPNLLIDTPPTAGNFDIYRNPGLSVHVLLSTLVTNSSDSYGDALVLTPSSTTASNATVTVNGGWVFYTPPAGFTNADSFTYTVTDTLGISATGTVTMAILAVNSASQNLVITNPGNGSTLIDGSGIPGYSYELQYSITSAPFNWQNLAGVIADATGHFLYTDTPPTNSPARFYRTIYP